MFVAGVVSAPVQPCDYTTAVEFNSGGISGPRSNICCIMIAVFSLHAITLASPGQSPLLSMRHQPKSIEFFLPDWLDEYIQNYRQSSDINDRMSFVIEASRRNVSVKTGGPFAAAVFEKETGALVSLGVNLVTTQGLSILHAEMVALTVAQKKLGSYDLGAREMPQLELVTSTEPCAMCYGAVTWSGVRRLITGSRDTDVCSIGFDEGPRTESWKEELELRGIEVITDVLRDDAARVLTDYLNQGGRIYNARNTS
jgi:tRNA(Arg) A34 adenosine deaminase TadA